MGEEDRFSVGFDFEIGDVSSTAPAGTAFSGTGFPDA